MNITRRVAKHVKDIGINLSELSRKTNIAYCKLYSSLLDDDKKRALRADELIKVCGVLKINPMDLDFKEGEQK